MFRVSRAVREVQTGINIGRAALAQQFATMDGWQQDQDSRFDEYVKAKRRREFYDAFDQRVERAYRSAAKLHKAEVMNSFKRRLTTTHEKFTAQTMLDMKAAVEERLRWLRDVWSQVDADYRSQDPQREEAAAREISAALDGEPGEYMRWLYETKREERFLGPKQKAALAAELENAELPDVSEDEVNRYHNLSVDMMEIEAEVKRKYGIAGQQHWAELQAAKDDMYEKKLDRAAQIYQELLQQSGAYDESRRTALLRSNVERVHQAQVRFKAAMALEDEREKLMEAHQAMEQARKQADKDRRIALLKEAAALKQSGSTSEEATLAMRERQLAEHARRQSEYQLQEQDLIRAKKAEYLDLIEKFKSDVEEREGRELLRGNGGSGEYELDGCHDVASPQPQQQQKRPSPRFSAFGFAEEDRLEGDSGISTSATADSLERVSSSSSSPSTTSGASAAASTTSPHAASKHVLWRDIATDTYEDPFHTIHQARLDAVKGYDPNYAKFFPMNTVQGKKYSRQGLGDMAVGGGMENQVMQRSNMNVESYSWGVRPHTVFDLDGDGNTDYFVNNTWHVRDKETGDIDYRYERRKGGAVFRGPRLYRQGALREAADPGEQSMDPMPHNANLPRNLRGGGGAQRSFMPSSSPQQQPPRRSVRLNRMQSSSSTPLLEKEASAPSSVSGDWRSN